MTIQIRVASGLDSRVEIAERSRYHLEMETRPSAAAHYVEIELDGTRFAGSYSVESGVVTVGYGRSTKSAQVDDSSSERVAKMLLRELIEQSFRGRP
jgi:hypothetical protein